MDIEKRLFCIVIYFKKQQNSTYFITSIEEETETKNESPPFLAKINDKRSNFCWFESSAVILKNNQTPI